MPTAILALVNALIPVVGNIIMVFKNSDGSTTALISSAQTATTADIQQMQAWLTAHQSGTVTQTAQPVVPAPAVQPISPAATTH